MVRIAYCEILRGDKNSDVPGEVEGTWLSWQEALQKAKQANKPILVLIQDPECISCKEFKEEFKSSVKAQEMCSDFVLATIPRKNATKEFTPDGDYVPRILFADSNGNLMSVYNELGNPRRMYNYPTIRSLLVSMAVALRENKNKKK